MQEVKEMSKKFDENDMSGFIEFVNGSNISFLGSVEENGKESKYWRIYPNTDVTTRELISVYMQSKHGFFEL